MYTIKAYVDGKDYVIHNPRVKALTVGDPYFEIGDNLNGQAEFTVYPQHPYYKYVKKLTTDIIFYNDGVEEFAGRVLYDDEDFKGSKKIFVEGELAYFCDSVQRPKVYHGVSVRNYLADLISIHNSQVEERKQFTLGRVSVTDPNDSLYRYSNWETTRECLKEKLTSRLGGHLVIRKQEGIRYLDYLNDDEFYHTSSQTIRFGKNLLDFAKNMDASDIATCIIPLGAKLDESSIEGLDERLTIASINGGVDYVTDDKAVAEYGKIYKTVIWDDVTVPQNLMRKAKEYLASVQFEKMVLECKAIDMSLANEDVEQFSVGSKVHCISEPNGLDSWFPLSKKKVYISNFKKNTITLGTETANKSYTSSQRQETASIEEEINSMPGKRELLQEALREATELINKLTQSGHAIHTPNEFIVADTPGVKDAQMLWRWGLGGLAHYSEGYDGPADGIALTMDGKINGKMLMVNSIYAESIDVGYRSSVEKQITEAETAAKEYSDEKLRTVKETIETSLKTAEDRIAMSVTSAKETILRKNYIANGEQETLNLSNFAISGAGSAVKAEYLHHNCIKLTWNSTGLIYITQALGTLESGKYKTSVMLAYPDGSSKRPTYVNYGFSGNQNTAYLSSYSKDEFHTFSKEVSITKASKSVQIAVYGSPGDECYITNIRCLRDMQELLDDLKSSLTVEVGKVEAAVTDLYENVQHDYCEDGSFSEPFEGTSTHTDYWYRNNTQYVHMETVDGENCCVIDLTSASSTNTHLRTWGAIKVPKTGKFTIRFKAKCSKGTARIRCSLHWVKYTSTGDIGTEWTNIEIPIENVPAGNKYFYIYNYTVGEKIYVKDVEILGYITGYSESRLSVLQDSISAEVERATGAEDTLKASIKVNADNITNAVKKGEFGSYVTQYYDRVITAFNNSSKYVQIKAGEIAIYDYGVTDSKKRSAFDENGNHFYRDGYRIGKIGTNFLKDYPEKKGLVFDLEYDGAYMTWSAKSSASANVYNMIWSYVQKGKGFNNYTENTLHAGCNIDMHNWKLINPQFEGGGINATIHYVQVLSMNSDGSVARWGPNGKMEFTNGILTDLTYYA